MRFRALGSVEVFDGEQSLPLAGGKTRALLAILLLNANRVVSVTRLIDLLWGEEPPETARNSLQVQVSQLRKILGRAAGQDHSLLANQDAGYVLRVGNDELDVYRFVALANQGREAMAAKQFEQGVERFREALGLWRGPPFAEFTEQPWALPEVKRLNELRLQALEDRIEAELALSRHANAVVELEGLLAEYPLRERLAAQLMLALYRSGRQADASAVYQRTRERLVDELGMEPGPELQALLVQVLQHDPGLNLAPFPGSGSRPPNDASGGTIVAPLLRVAERDYALTQPEVLVGRRSADGSVSPDIDLAPVDHMRRVSRRHALILNKEGGRFIRDLGSLNGTSCNGVALTAHVDQPLQSGDQLSIGGLPALYVGLDDTTQSGP